jgi:PAS domain S-box-containing protein
MDIRTQPSLRSSLQLLLNATLDAIVVMDAGGRVAEWSERAAEMFGWSAVDAVGSELAGLIIPQRYRKAHAEGLAHFLRTGEGPLLKRRTELSALRKSGEEFPVELTISAIAEEHGRHDGHLFVGSLRDLSGQKRAEAFQKQQALKADVLYRIIAYAGESRSFQDALKRCLESIQRLTQWPLGHVYLPTEEEPVVLVPSEIWIGDAHAGYATLREHTAQKYLSPGEGLPGEVWRSGNPYWVADVASDPHFARPEAAVRAGVKSAFAFPIVSDGRIIAVIEFFTDVPSEPEADLLLAMRSIGEQVGRVFERRRAEQALREQTEALQSELAERKRGEEHQRMLLAELNHRVKNMLAVVTGIAAQTARSSRSISAFNENFMARLSSLSLAHSLLTAGNWQAMSLRQLVEELLGPYANPNEGQLSIGGPEIAMRPKGALAMSMILHELITNATKYGALARPEGRIFVEWIVSPEPAGRVSFAWRETGVAGLTRPRRSGFGTRMIEASVRHELGGEVEVTYGAEGIAYRFEFPSNQ